MKKTITQHMLDYVKQCGPVSYTELNMEYYFLQGGRDYDPVKDRGGSYPHHHASLRSQRVRRGDNTQWQWIDMNDDGKYIYRSFKRRVI